MTVSFRLKTIIGIAAIEAILLFILIWSSMNFLLQSNEDELIKYAKTTATLFSTTTKDAVLATDLASLESFTAEILKNQGVRYARIISDTNIVLAEAGDKKALSKPFVEDKLLSDVTDSIYDTYASISESGKSYGRVEIGIDIGNISNVLSSARRKTSIIAMIEMALTALFSFILGTYLTRQLKSLKDASNRLAAGQLGYQVVVHGNDELAETARAFNEMSRKLNISQNKRQQAEQELNRLNDDLEQRVNLRTKKLATLNKALEKYALYDPLTKLPNRLLFMDRVSQALLNAEQNNKQLGIVIIDLDDFHTINDMLGRRVGDLVLQHFAYRLRDVLNTTDTASRISGDKYIVLIDSIEMRDAIISKSRDILTVLEKPLLVENENFDISARLGYSVYPDDGGDFNTLMRRAEIALRKAKNEKTDIVAYHVDIESEAQKYVDIHTELHNAIKGKDIIVHYQPEINFTDSRVCAVVALARWNHPEQGLIMAEDFIAVAEQTGLIKALTESVLQMSLDQAQLWHQQGYAIPVAISVSSASFQEQDFPDHVLNELAKRDLPSPMLELIVTQSSLMLDPFSAMDSIVHLHNAGIRVSVSDLGSDFGYMSYLKKLMINKVRIDRSLVVDMLHNAYQAEVVHSIISLAHSLDMEVSVSGVENETLWTQLKTLGCDYGIGFYISESLAPDQLTDWLLNSQWSINSEKRKFRSQ